MYRIDDRPEAIRSVQRYLRIAGNPDIFIMPSGVYDENTRLSVMDFQSENQLLPTGIVDYTTFVLLFNRYVYLTEIINLNKKFDSFVSFPLLPGDMNDAMIHLNRTMRRLLNYYGFTSRLNESNFYSNETTRAVDILRSLYMLEPKELIDEELYIRMIRDHNSIGLFNNNFL